MKNKNKKLIIVVASLFLVIGVSFAYFTVSVLLDGKGASTSGTTATLGSSELKVEGSLSFSDLDIYPGHQNVSSIKVSATGENELIPYHVIWEGENTLNTTLKYYVYKVERPVEVKATCEKKNGIKDGAKTYYEECSISNESELGSIIASGEIKTGETKKRIITDEFITSSKEGEEVYYYVILEYPNNNENQNRDIGGRFKGEVTVEINDTTPDISIIGTYIEENGGYKEVSEIPREGYELNTEKSSCNNNAKLGWDKENSRIYVERLNKSGTECTLYYDEYNLYAGKEYILSHYDTILTRSDFNTRITDITTETIYKSKDESQYDEDGEVYYYAGNPTDNWMYFAGYYWRIIRINGNGSIRLIYNGNDTKQIGDSTQIGNSSFNNLDNDNAYVGYMYGDIGASSYALTHMNNNDSVIKKLLDEWYYTNLKDYDKYISLETSFCGDRTVSSSDTGYGNISSEYGASLRLRYSGGANPQTSPVFKCNDADLYTTTLSNKGNRALTYPIGLITADEIVYAGGMYAALNDSFYLFNGQSYWTITPHSHGNAFIPSLYKTYLFDLNFDNGIGSSVSTASIGVRPVINIASDVELTGSGTSADPFVVI